MKITIDTYDVALLVKEMRENFEENGACEFGVECLAAHLQVYFAENSEGFNEKSFRVVCGLRDE